MMAIYLRETNLCLSQRSFKISFLQFSVGTNKKIDFQKLHYMRLLFFCGSLSIVGVKKIGSLSIVGVKTFLSGFCQNVLQLCDFF